MAKTNRARGFEAAMRPQMEAIRGVHATIAERRNTFSHRHGVQLLADQVDALATAMEELLDATAAALDA